MNILLVHPRDPDSFWSIGHALRLASKKAAFPPPGWLTVAAMLPRDCTLRLADPNVQTLRDEPLIAADSVLMSAMNVHQTSGRDVARRCAALARPLIWCGPLFTSGHRALPEVPHFVLGEAEDGPFEEPACHVPPPRRSRQPGGPSRRQISSTSADWFSA